MLKNRIKPSDSVSQLIYDVADVLHQADQSCSWEYSQSQATMIVSHIVQQPLIRILNSSLSDEQFEMLEHILHEHINHNKPLAYCFGSVDFLSLNLAVKPPILIPRPETEEWVAHIIERYTHAGLIPSKILDMCTGSGAIGLALAHTFIKSSVLGIDNNPQAITLATLNKERHKIDNISFLLSDLYNELTPMNFFDLMVSNPPYISAQAWQSLDKSVKDWEDPYALCAANNGLALIEEIVMRASDYLSATYYELYEEKKLPNIVIEIGYDQAQSVEDLLRAAGGINIKTHKDLAKNDRWTEALLMVRK